MTTTKDTPQTTPYWIGVVEPRSQAGHGFWLEAESVEQARELAARQVALPFVVNGVGVEDLERRGMTIWLWSRLRSGQ